MIPRSLAAAIGQRAGKFQNRRARVDQRSERKRYQPRAAAARLRSLAVSAVWRSAERSGFKGFHDVKISVDKSWAAGKYVVSEGSVSGTNDGNMPSMKLEKTGKHVNVRFVQIDELTSGKLTRQRIFDNGMAFAMQFGLVPPPGAPDAKKKPLPPKS